MDRDEVLRMARALGLEIAAEKYPDDVIAAARLALDVAGKLRRDIDPRAEPAHVYRIPQVDHGR